MKPCTNRTKSRRFFNLFALTGLAAALSVPAHAQMGWEYTEDEGVTREEWWDPTDWFDDEFDNDSYASYWNNDVWSNDFDANEPSARDGYAYDWNDATDRWERRPVSSSNSSDSAYDYDPMYVIYTYTTTDGQRQQDRQRMNQSSQGNSSKDTNKANQKQSQRQLQGEIAGFRTMELKDRNGQTDEFAVVKLRLDSGRHTVVSLGRKDDVQRLNLEQGDRVKLKGSSGKIDGQPVFIARELHVNGQSIDVNRAIRQKSLKSGQQDQNSSSSSGGWKQSTASFNPEQQNRDDSRNTQGDNRDNRSSYRYDASQGDWSSSPARVASRERQRQADEANSQSSASGQMVTLRGRVQDFQRMEISRDGEGQGREQPVLRLRLDNGRTALISLGDEASISDLDLQRDDQVVIRGERQQWGDRHVVEAQRIRIEGETVMSSS